MTKRLTAVDALRGLAALSVCAFHFTDTNAFLPAWIRKTGSFGWLGVHTFFVISGFIIPYAMQRRGYDVRSDAPRFVVKRILRLDPPYLVAVLLSVALWYVSSKVPGFRGADVNVTAAQVLAHVGYLNGFLGLPWLNPVFWSLAIEFQFYLAIAFAFPLIAHRRTPVRLWSLAVLGALALVPSSPLLVVHYAGLFGCGLASFQFYDRRCSWLGFLGLSGSVAAITAVSAGLPTAIVAFVTSVAVAWGRGGNPVASWFGKISYSLYLVHVPIGGRVINLGARLVSSAALSVLFLAAAFAASILGAWLLYRLIELPAQRWSASVRYKSDSSGALALASTVVTTAH